MTYGSNASPATNATPNSTTSLTLPSTHLHYHPLLLQRLRPARWCRLPPVSLPLLDLPWRRLLHQRLARSRNNHAGKNCDLEHCHRLRELEPRNVHRRGWAFGPRVWEPQWRCSWCSSRVEEEVEVAEANVDVNGDHREAQVVGGFSFLGVRVFWDSFGGEGNGGGMRKEAEREQEENSKWGKMSNVRFVNRRGMDVRGKIIIIYIQRRFSWKPSLKCSRYLHNCHYYTNENYFLTTVVDTVS